MKKALDPVTKKLTDVPNYVQKHGNKLDDQGKPNPRPPALCPFCKFTMHTVGENNHGNVDAVFSHDRSTPNKLAPWCVLKESAGWKYEGLTPTTPDVQKGAELRNQFLQNWEKHWALIRRYVEFPDIFVFVEIIKFADKKKIWQHKGLRENLIPYVFMTLAEFAPPKGKIAIVRPHTVRFRFGNSVRTLEDLWIKTTNEISFFKVVYVAPKPPKRVASEVLDVFELTLDLDFLLQTQTPTHAFQIDIMRKNFMKSF